MKVSDWSINNQSHSDWSINLTKAFLFKLYKFISYCWLNHLKFKLEAFTLKKAFLMGSKIIVLIKVTTLFFLHYSFVGEVTWKKLGDKKLWEEMKSQRNLKIC